jgi:hypothetical protein
MKQGPKYFVTLDVVPCYYNNEIKKGAHRLPKRYDYSTTNAQYLTNGDLYFELWDDTGYIGCYVVDKQFLYLIQELTEEEWMSCDWMK